MTTIAADTSGRRRPAKSPPVPALAAAPTGAEDLCEVRCVNRERIARARAVMPATESVGALAETFRVLGDPTRLRVVRALIAEELCVCDIATLLGLSQPTVSHSLRALRQLRLVRYRKVGKIAYYAIDDEHVRHLVNAGFVHVGEAKRG